MLKRTIREGRRTENQFDAILLLKRIHQILERD